MNEDKLRDELARGDRAAALVNDEMFAGAFDAVRASILKNWEATVNAQGEERERLWLMLKLLDRVKATLVETVETGKLASISLADLDKQRSM